MAKQGEIIKNYDKSPEMGEVDYVVEWQKPTEKNGYTWYRLYASGWIIQGGYTYTGSSVAGAHVITFPKSFNNTKYHVILTCLHSGDGGTPNDISDVYPYRTNYSMRIYVRAGWCGYTWEVKGYSA